MDNRIKELIQEKGTTAAEIAKAIGLTPVSLYNIINGKHDPSAKTLQKIASALKVNLWELFVLSEKEKREINALVKFGPYFYEASTIEELEEVINTIKKIS